jgi:Nuclease-related domain
VGRVDGKLGSQRIDRFARLFGRTHHRTETERAQAPRLPSPSNRTGITKCGSTSTRALKAKHTCASGGLDRPTNPNTPVTTTSLQHQPIPTDTTNMNTTAKHPPQHNQHTPKQHTTGQHPTPTTRQDPRHNTEPHAKPTPPQNTRQNTSQNTSQDTGLDTGQKLRQNNAPRHQSHPPQPTTQSPTAPTPKMHRPASPATNPNTWRHPLTTTRHHIIAYITTNRRYRQWNLARTSRSAQWARQQLTQQHQTFHRKHRPTIAKTATIFVALALSVLYWLPAPTPTRWFIIGCLTTAFPCIIHHITIANTGTSYKLSGIDAERLTATELRKLRRHGWQLINNMPLHHEDVDHILLGHGRILALETKWSTEPWTINTEHPTLDRFVNDTAHRAKRIEKILTTNRQNTITVEPILVLWGTMPDKHLHTKTVHNRKVRIIHGTTLTNTLRHTTTAPGPIDTTHAWNTLATHTEMRDRYEQNRNPQPPKPTTNALQATLGLTTGIALPLAALTTAQQLFGNTTPTLTIFLTTLAILPAIAYRHYQHHHKPLYPTGILSALITYVITTAAIYLR